MNQGWIKLYRQIQDCWIWESSKEEPFNRGTAWIDLLLSCNHADKKMMFDGKVCEVKRGEMVTSIVKLGDRWCWGRKKVSNFLDVLEAEGMIIQERNSRRTLIKIVNYDVYQDSESPKEQPRNISGTSQEHPRNTNKNDKNEKNEKNIYKATSNIKDYQRFIKRDYGDMDELERELLNG